MAQIEIGFIGLENSDMILYLARLYAATDKKVAVIDYTKKQIIQHMVSLPETLPENSGFYKNILILNGELDHTKDKSAQDVVIYNFGYHLDNEVLKKCPNVVYVSDMVPGHAQLLKDVTLAEEVAVHFVIRNYASFKYDEKYLIQSIGREFDEENVLQVPYDESDYKFCCYLCIDKKQKLSSLSSYMKAAIQKLFDSTSEKEYGRKEMSALLKRA